MLLKKQTVPPLVALHLPKALRAGSYEHLSPCWNGGWLGRVQAVIVLWVGEDTLFSSILNFSSYSLSTPAFWTFWGKEMWGRCPFLNTLQSHIHGTSTTVRLCIDHHLLHTEASLVSSGVCFIYRCKGKYSDGRSTLCTFSRIIVGCPLVASDLPSYSFLA